MVEKEADERDRQDSSEGEREIEDVVNGDGEGGRVEEGRVLWPDGGDEVVYTGHLDDCAGKVSFFPPLLP